VSESVGTEDEDNPFVSIGYLIKRTGTSRTRCFQLTQRPSFPKPVQQTALGRLWRREDVDQWIATYRPGDAQQPTDS
jgi:predicted DNA-binding transcriptional regulator AlpA